jgi:DNA-binding response OmpR family regulator
MRRKGHVVPRDTIMETVWGYGASVEANTLDAFVRLLRMKIEDSGSKRLLQTVRGVGYTIREPEE